VRAMIVDGSKVKDRLDRVKAALTDVLWPGAQVVVWYDEAQQLMNTPRVFMNLTDNTAERNDAAPRDALYGLTALMISLIDDAGWKQVVCGPWLELSDKITLSDFSCAHSRVKSLHHATSVTVSTMLDSLCHYFNLKPEDIPTETCKELQQLRGRPRWFFDGFWPCCLHFGSRVSNLCHR
jgi:hypothetical protein